MAFGFAPYDGKRTAYCFGKISGVIKKYRVGSGDGRRYLSGAVVFVPLRHRAPHLFE